MDLEEFKKDLKRIKDRAEKNLVTANNEIEKYKDATQPTNEELYKNIDKIVDIKLSKKKYKHILGGDGRSLPWDETRLGMVAEIRVKKGYYLSSKQYDLVEQYVKTIHEPEHISFLTS